MRSQSLRTSITTFACLSGCLAASIQGPNVILPEDAVLHRQNVKDIFMTSWNAYIWTDGRNGWGASLVDGLTTLAIMGEMNVFEEAVNHIATVDFAHDHSGSTASVFESTIRYVGALLSAYELSNATFPVLVKQAQTLADRLAGAWSGGNTIPYGHVNTNTTTPIVGPSSIAEAGTLTLEWSRLAYTGNDKYRTLAESAPKPLPGFPAQGIDPTTSKPVGAHVTWGGGSDSYLEYLIKYARLTNTNDSIFADNWATAVDSSIRTLLRTSTVGNWTYLADQDDSGTIRYIGSHLACFMAGNWIMGGRLLNNQTIVNLGLDLNEGCWNTYASTATGIGPEAFGFFSSDGNYTGSIPTADQRAFYNQHGFFILSGDEYYYMRPEVLESNFYAWRYTGDVKYYTRAISAYQSFQKYLKAPNMNAFAPINNVNELDSGCIDDMESFWFAEVLKYLYLTFDDPSHISLDEYVFNTEAHPYIAPAAKASYGSGQLYPEPSEPFKTNLGALPLRCTIRAWPTASHVHSLHSVHNALEFFPNVETLSLTYNLADKNRHGALPELAKTIHLPHLRHIVIEDVPIYIPHFLSHLAFPSTTSLVLEPAYRLTLERPVTVPVFLSINPSPTPDAELSLYLDFSKSEGLARWETHGADARPVRITLSGGLIRSLDTISHFTRELVRAFTPATALTAKGT
ncbi:glycoside hydrolase, partial [Ganoderma leucocontextum]